MHHAEDRQWEKLTVPDATATPTPTATPTTDGTEEPAPAGVWHGKFYNNPDLMEPPAAEADFPWIGFEWGSESPMPGIWADNFSVRWTQTVHFEAGDYRFCMMIDDGGRLWVDDDLVVDEWHVTNAVAFCGEKTLEAGDYVITVEYFEWTGEALIYVWWE